MSETSLFNPHADLYQISDGIGPAVVIPVYDFKLTLLDVLTHVTVFIDNPFKLVFSTVSVVFKDTHMYS